MKTFLLVVGILSSVSYGQVQVPFGVEGKFALVVMPSVKKELKITKEQDKALADLMKEMQSNPQKFVSGFDMTYMLKGVDEKVDAILTEKQRLRMKELWYRLNGPMILRLSGPAEEIGLNDDQRAQIGSLCSEADSKIMQAIQQGSRQTKFPEKLREVRTTYGKQVLDRLTPDQKEAWKKALGKDFKF